MSLSKEELIGPLFITLGLILAGCILAVLMIWRKQRQLREQSEIFHSTKIGAWTGIFCLMSITSLPYGLMVLMMSLTSKRSMFSWNTTDIVFCIAMGLLNLFACAGKGIVSSKSMEKMLEESFVKQYSITLIKIMAIEVLPIIALLCMLLRLRIN